MRVFICEYVTSGGMRDKPLPEAALAEGRLIRDAIVTDLQELVGINVVLAYDDRLPPPNEEAVPVRKGDDPWIIWSGLAQDADVVWPIAPEAGGLLARLARLMREGGARTLASSGEAVILTSNRLALARRLAEYGIPHVPTYPLDALPSGLDGDLVTRPEDGTGWSAARAWPNRAALPRAGGLVVQPFLNGNLASLSVLVRPDGVTLLAANRLSISHLVGVFAFEGVQVGGIADEDGRLAETARRVVEAIPGLSGIVCIDVILTPEGPVVAEVNPRVTASYAGLHAALGVNPLAFVPELIREGVPPSMPRLPRPTPVEVKIR
ncbi:MULTISPECIES: ATP-grasp domain-containing protein [Xanthobacter]|uniref:ATP-grasp domain-containing protein n=1 Tax=Xanthobacter aminoxidans TaxID=186280 RepID=A0ABW6ZE55_9HYPH|nr:MULTISPECIES: ATP-grasp domain-containing protein [Xanthobacter]MCL8381797.1 ATP-grasp domain-containing protein [Xanthobacter aminoxidans]